MAAPAALAGPPIFNPGAPGAETRVVSAGEAVEMSRTGFIEADIRFMQHMIVHHAQAVEMVALIEGRDAGAGVRRIGERIALSQDAEMALMRDWLTRRDQPLEDAHLHAGGHGHDAPAASAGHDHHSAHGSAHGAHHADPDPLTTPVMPGMLSPAQMAALAAASGREFDRLFLEGMIAHHEGALDMVDALLADPAAAEDPFLSDFAASVVADQSAEILRMQSMLSEL